MDEWFAIANPTAGHGQCGRRLSEALEQMRSRGISVRAETTSFAGHGVDLAREALRRGHSKLLAIGGEGTVNEVLNGIGAEGRTGGDVTLATLPLGTCNSFLRDFGILDVDAAIDRIAAGAAPPCDVLACRISVDGAQAGRWALNNVIIGFGADVGALMNRRLKVLGRLGYTVGVLVTLARLRPPVMNVQLDGMRAHRRITMINVGNSQFTGATMHISPGALVDDGILDVLVIDRLNRRELLHAFPLIFTGEHLRDPHIRLVKGPRVRVEAERTLPLLIDGDVIGTTPVEIEVLPRVIRFVR